MEIVENNKESIEKFHSQGWGGTDNIINQEMLKALLEGKLIGLNDGEYTHTFKVEGMEVKNV